MMLAALPNWMTSWAFMLSMVALLLVLLLVVVIGLIALVLILVNRGRDD